MTERKYYTKQPNDLNTLLCAVCAYPNFLATLIDGLWMCQGMSGTAIGVASVYVIKSDEIVVFLFGQI